MNLFSKFTRRKRSRDVAAPRAAGTRAYLDSIGPPIEHETSEDAIARIAQSVEVLKRLADLREQVEATEPALEEADVAVADGAPQVAATAVRRPARETTRHRDDGAPGRRDAGTPAKETGWRPIGTVVSEPVAESQTESVIDLADTPPAWQPARTRPTPLRPASTDQLDLRSQIGIVFSPSAPVTRRDLFAGRTRQMEDLVDTVYERGQHAVIYGERGVGKTSLAVTMGLVLEQSGTAVVRINCDGADDFTSIWRKILVEVQAGLPSPSDPAVMDAIAEISEKEGLTPNDVRQILQTISTQGELVFFIDEFDTVRDTSVHGLFADTIKTLSDQLVPCTLVIIGVADNLDELIAEHGSVRRALAQIHMPRMSPAELAEIVGRGLRVLGLPCEGTALARMTLFAQGFPYYVKLLAQSATRSAMDSGHPGITLDDVDWAVRRVIDRVHESIRNLYSLAVHGDDEHIQRLALQVGAFAPCDDRGYFGAGDSLHIWKKIGQEGPDVGRVAKIFDGLTDPERGPALEAKDNERGRRYRFGVPLLQPYVLMEGYVAGDIEPSVLDELAQQAGPRTRVKRL